MIAKFENIFKVSLYALMFFLIGTYILGRVFSYRYLLSFTNFDSNSGVLWIIIISLILAHIPTLKSIVREVASGRVAHLTDDDIVILFEQRAIGNEDFFRLIAKKINEIGDKDRAKGIPEPEDGITSGSKK